MTAERRKAQERKSSAEAATGETRLALVDAALQLFGDKGFEATSTREIAARANANIASIAYHFGGKQGLREACARAVAMRLKTLVGEAILANEIPGDGDAALRILEAGLKAFAHFIITRPEARNIAAFMLREIGRPGPTLDLIYGELVDPVHTRLCELLGVATGRDPKSPTIKLAAFTLAGQVVYFRIGREVVLKKMDWREIGPDEADDILALIVGNLRAFVEANRSASS